MRILEHVGPKVHILFSMIFSSEFVTISGGDKGGGGSKIVIFTVTYFLNDPLLSVHAFIFIRNWYIKP